MNLPQTSFQGYKSPADTLPPTCPLHSQAKPRNGPNHQLFLGPGLMGYPTVGIEHLEDPPHSILTEDQWKLIPAYQPHQRTDESLLCRVSETKLDSRCNSSSKAPSRQIRWQILLSSMVMGGAQRWGQQIVHPTRAPPFPDSPGIGTSLVHSTLAY
jgi:hypothetical protein